MLDSGNLIVKVFDFVNAILGVTKEDWIRLRKSDNPIFQCLVYFYA